MQREVLADGIHAGYGGDPAGVPVVLVHGAMDRGAAFLRATRLLPDLWWWVYDRRGYGRSATAVPARIDDHVADLLAVAATVAGRSGRHPVLVGHSLGGTVALGAAAHPGAGAAVVAYESPLTWEPWWPRHGPGGGPDLADEPPDTAAERFVRRVAGDASWDGLTPALRDRRRADGRALVAELRSAREGAPFDPAEVTVPCVIARGAGTDPHRTRAAAELVARLPAAELVVVPDADHGIHTSRPAAFAALVRRGVELAGRGRVAPGPDASSVAP